jgi:putative MATE family efflux protein
MVKNLTVGNPAKVIILFTIPLFVGYLLQQSYNIADTFIVGNTVGVNALAAVGCTGSISFLILGFLMGFVIGGTVITSQRFGAGDMDGVKRSFAAIIVISIGVAVVMTLISVISAMPLLKLLQTPDDIIEDAYNYIIVIYWGIPTAMLFNLFANAMRAVGDSRTPLYFLTVACVLNIALDLVFILVFKTGLWGVALATVIAQLVSGLLCLLFILKRMPVLQITKEHWRFKPGEIAAHLKLALPVGFQMSIIAIGTITVTWVVNRMGTTAVAAFTAASRVDVTAYILLNSIGTAMTTYSAQNYGAKKYDRIRKGIAYISVIACSYCVIMAVIFITTGRSLASLFLGHEANESLDMAHTYLIIGSSLYMVLAMLFIFRQSLIGLGDSVTPTIAGFMELGMRVFAAIILGNIIGFTGVSWANPMAWIGAMIPLSIVMLHRLKKLKMEEEANR